jgi:P-type Ca2+ transporter type 2C
MTFAPLIGRPPESDGELKSGSENNRWYRLSADQVLRQLRADPAVGLSDAEAGRRRAQYGINQLVETGAKSPWLIFWDQLTGLMVVILIVAAAISALLKDYRDALAILMIVLLNALLGFAQEYRAEKAIVALKKLAAPSVKVRRGGEVREIEAASLVPGDITLLEAGAYVAADGRLLESANLHTQESSLTGESEPARKAAAAIDREDLPVGDRYNMVYAGTFVAAGRGEAVVTATAMRTELGRIAGMIRSVDRQPTPLQLKLDQLGKQLAIAALAVVAVIFAVGWFRGEDTRILFLTAVSIGVAAIPEGLPAVVTIALTLGARRMLKRNVLIRKLSAVETLGSVTVICSDKTGTLTENRMTVELLALPDHTVDLAGKRSSGSEDPLPEPERPGFELLLAGAALCNDAVGRSGAAAAGPALLGDPTETALLAAASRFGLEKAVLDRNFPRIAEAPFSAERKRMTTIHRVAAGSAIGKLVAPASGEGDSAARIAFTKGSVEGLLQVCGSVWIGGRIERLDQTWRERIAASNDALAARGMRVLAVAFRALEPSETGADEKKTEQNLTYVGMLGLIDPPRPEAAPAVARCKQAGIRPVMITGDHPLTARYIATQVGIDGSAPAVTGAQLDRMSGADLDAIAGAARVYARVSPEHKLKIVESLQRRGNVVAMTGDGVNDAPALKRADIGVAMGITGTEVAKEAAAMVLLDDNFATIVAAVEEGRVIYDNVRKFLRYILGTNSGEIFVMLFALLVRMPLALLPIQILWMNLVTDGLPALATTVEPAEPDTMQRPPRNTMESFFSRGMGRQIIWVGLIMGTLSLAVGYGYWRTADPRWQTILFTTLTFAQMAHVLAIRSERRSLLSIGLFSNAPLLGAVALTVALQLAIIYWPALRGVFKTAALTPAELAITFAVPVAIFAGVELEKWRLRRRGHA